MAAEKSVNLRPGRNSMFALCIQMWFHFTLREAWWVGFKVSFPFKGEMLELKKLNHLRAFQQLLWPSQMPQHVTYPSSTRYIFSIPQGESGTLQSRTRVWREGNLHVVSCHAFNPPHSCVYEYMCMFICMCKYICLCAYMCVMCIFMYVFLCVYVYSCMYISVIYVHVYMFIYVYVRAYFHVHIHLCMYYISCMYMHMYMSIYMCMHMCLYM